MPRHVDPDERRHLVAHAVWRVVLRSGLATASVRAVAEEAGLSVGSLRHYFSEQKGLELYALELINQRTAARVSALDLGPDVPLRARIETLMWAMLPVTPEQVEEEQVRQEFLVRARTVPALAEVVRAERQEALDLTRRAIIGLRDSRVAPPDLDVEAATLELLALLDGLAQTAALHQDQLSPDQLKDTIRQWLDRLEEAAAQAP